MSEDTYTVGNDEYIFPPDEVCKPEENEDENIIFEGENR